MEEGRKILVKGGEEEEVESVFPLPPLISCIIFSFTTGIPKKKNRELYSRSLFLALIFSTFVRSPVIYVIYATHVLRSGQRVQSLNA